jgi:hypothetical protein
MYDIQMSIRLRFEKGTLSTQVILTDEALSELLAIIGKYQSDEVEATTFSQAAPLSEGNPSSPVDRVEVTKSILASRSSSEVLNYLGWNTNVDKILILAAFHEANGGAEGWRSSDVESRFAEAKESKPGNLARDLSKAIKEGLLATVTPRTYRVSRTGWNRMYEGIHSMDRL